ncbi:DUF302 domain-containing protein [Faunimonas sp. B44]|uniref:DUF302 domain-containing protein n=1 Tax=Faunimonas sp. B44 TaxID=3461493 RepID=UPI004043F631
MTYYHARTVDLPFEQAVERTIASLQAEGFGVLSDIDVAATLKKKIGVDFRPYRILGACNPQMAHRALQAEDKIGTMLPCNVIIQEVDSGQSEIAAVDPVASMQAVQNPGLSETANKVRAMLMKAVDAVGA